MKENIQKIFKNWNETIIWSCLQGIMGEIHTNLSEDAAMAILGDFAFYAGNPSEELVKYKPESCKQDFIIMVPQNAGWAELIEKCYGDKAKKVTRYAIKKEMDIVLCKMVASLMMWDITICIFSQDTLKMDSVGLMVVKKRL